MKFFSDNFPYLDVATNNLGYIECCDYIFVYTVLLFYAVSIERASYFVENLLKIPPKILHVIETVVRELSYVSKIDISTVSNLLTNCLADHPNLELVFLNGFQINQPLPETPTRKIKQKNQEIKEIQQTYETTLADMKMEMEKDLKTYKKRVEVLGK